MPAKAQAVLSRKSRYKVLYGGRGSGKSYAIANFLIAESFKRAIRVLCCRELQNSIRDSVHRLLYDRILDLGFEEFFEITQDSVKNIYGSEFIFKGIKNNPSTIRSMQGIDYVWCEEAENISEESWDILTPTIREEDSEILVSFNPESENSATYRRFIKSPREDVVLGFLNWSDNAYFPSVLQRDMEFDKRNDYDKYLHIWEGQLKKYSDELIFKNKILIEPYETPLDTEFKFGADFGFSEDPTCLIRHFIKDNKLFIDHEFYGHGIELTELHRCFHTVPESKKWKITADSQRPDTISFLNKGFTDQGGTYYEGFNIVGAEKGSGSVEDGIEFLRGFEKIVIHPRCKGSISDYSNYRWKKDRITGEILPVPIDKSNHACDASRYAIEDYMKAKNPDIRWLL